MCIKKIYIYLFIYFKPLKGEAIHETGLSGNVVASFFPLIIFICLYMYIKKKNIYIYISLFVPFIFLILSCWISSSNDVIWIFVSFVGFVSIVSGNSLNFFNGYEFNHLKIFVSKLIITASRQSFLFIFF